MNNKQLIITSKSGQTKFELKKVNHPTHVEFEITAQGEVVPNDTLIIQWSLASANIMSQWHPIIGMDRSLKADWDSPISISNSCSGPIFCLLDGKDQNIQTFALSEFINPTQIYGGIREEDGRFMIKVEIEMSSIKSGYQVRLYINETNEKYYYVLAKIVSWWQKACLLDTLPVPIKAKQPMFSTWYAYHQEISDEDLLAEARVAKSLGMNTMIIDDGWQTNDDNRGYGYTGDWQISNEKFTNFKAYVDANHEMGMNVMMWYSVPFIGKYANKWNELSNKMLSYDESRQAGILDIRYKENCNYLIETYVKAVLDWDLDGMKLDFIDEFYLRNDSKEYDSSMDFSTVQLGLDYLLREIKECFLTLKPDFLFEFRQRYIGPAMRQYSNMFRVDDCPKSALMNRVGLVDLRLISGETSCHSDMLMWHPEETSENVAIQLLSCIYGVLQISVKLLEISNKHKKVLQNYLAFSSEHSKLLLNSILQAEESENLYPVVRVENETTSIITLYSKDRFIILNESIKKTIILNATQSEKLILFTAKHQPFNFWVFNCFGEVCESGEVEILEPVSLNQYPGGRIELIQIS